MEKEEDKLNFIFHSRPRISHIQLSFGSFFFFFFPHCRTIYRFYAEADVGIQARHI